MLVYDALSCELLMVYMAVTSVMGQITVGLWLEYGAGFVIVFALWRIILGQYLKHREDRYEDEEKKK